MMRAFRELKKIIEPVVNPPQQQKERYTGTMIKNHELPQRVTREIGGESHRFYGKLREGKNTTQALQILGRLGTRLPFHQGGPDGMPPVNVIITHDGQGNVRIHVEKYGSGGGFTIMELAKIWHPELPEKIREARKAEKLAEEIREAKLAEKMHEAQKPVKHKPDLGDQTSQKESGPDGI